MSNAMDVDAPASHTALEHLKRKYKSTAIAGEQLVNGSHSTRPSLTIKLDMASAIDQSPRFFCGQFLHVVGDVQDRPASHRQGHVVQVLCGYSAVRQLVPWLPRVERSWFDNSRARSFSRVICFELMSESIKPALETTMEDVAELTAHRTKTSERSMRVNRDLAIVKVDLNVALDKLRLYDDFEERLAAAREKSWAHQAKAQGSIAYPGLTLNKS
ncbi:hypothetical protein BCR44DRAFT_1515301 [Catenaria anguillulae PL171]|uniref:Uncharacterized protein n=1 Tax=Catenaria anguillulae PL171 TaxID=765915 RepID=A0A1Y2HDE1_9FUNG|nr:hypothetical protein BCR44DRAFT_1515301 [Catenaria anguillulae PL171]